MVSYLIYFCKEETIEEILNLPKDIKLKERI